jgi:hypothetical protein
MFARSLLSLLVVGTTLAVAWGGASERAHAGGGTEALVDTDNDFLPDCVEWAVLTSAANPDTDGDEISDFVEVVQRGAPRKAGDPLPTDQEMRLVVTGPSAASPGAAVWLHLLVRTVETSTPIANFSSWIELPSLPGLQIPLNMLAFGNIEFRQRLTAAEGNWVIVSVPLVSTTILQAVLPCSFHAMSMIGGRHLRSTVQLLDMQGTISSLVSYGENSFAVQSIAPIPGGGLSNRVCVIDLQEVGSGVGGTVYQVISAFCDDCNEVECSPNCPQTVGWLVTIPGGMCGMTSQD